jgi:hypothetical protein
MQRRRLLAEPEQINRRTVLGFSLSLSVGGTVGGLSGKHGER